jgi:hypothetical protein
MHFRDHERFANATFVNVVESVKSNEAQGNMMSTALTVYCLNTSVEAYWGLSTSKHSNVAGTHFKNFYEITCE